MLPQECRDVGETIDLDDSGYIDFQDPRVCQLGSSRIPSCIAHLRVLHHRSCKQEFLMCMRLFRVRELGDLKSNLQARVRAAGAKT